MKQRVMVSAGSQSFEFEGEILELEPDYLILKAKHGDIYIERKYLVFIQFLNEPEPETEELVLPQKQFNQPKPLKVDAAAKFVNRRLKRDPVEEKLEHKYVPPTSYMQVPPSQLPDEPVFDEEDLEAAVNVYGAIHGLDNPVTKAANLRAAVKTAMQNEDTDFSMGASGGKYQNPAQTILGMKNASNKKS